MKKIIFILLTIIPLIMNSQEKNLPFSEIGDYPSEFTPANVISRLIDGLGYRFYWSTESLTENDLNYKLLIKSIFLYSWNSLHFLKCNKIP